MVPWVRRGSQAVSNGIGIREYGSVGRTRSKDSVLMLVVCGNPCVSDVGGWKSGENKGSSTKESQSPVKQQYIQ